MFNFRKLALLLLLFTLTISMTGLSCKNQKSQDQQQITITMWHLFDSEEAFQPIIKAYQQKNPNVKINFVQKDYSEYEDDVLDALAEGVGPDILLIRNDWLDRYYKKLAPMPNGLISTGDKQKRSDLDVFKASMVPVVSEDAIMDNKIYALPLYVDTLALYYNAGIFKELYNQYSKANDLKKAAFFAQPPGTWEDVIEITKILTQKDGDNIKRAGIALGTSQNISQPTDILYALMLQNHTKMVADDKKSAAFNLSIKKETGEPVYPGTQALDFYTSFSNSAKETYTWNASMPKDADAFAQGKLVMMLDYSFLQKTLLQIAPNLNYGIAPFPQIKDATTSVDYASYWMETVTKNSKNPEVAWDFIKSISNSLDTYLSASHRPSPAKSDLVPEVNQRVANKGKTFAFQAMTAQDWFKGRYPLKVDKIFSDLIDSAVVYKQPLQNAIDTAANKVTNLLGRE